MKVRFNRENLLFMLHRYYAPPKELEGLVRHFWILDFDHISKDNNQFRVFARRYPRIVIQHQEGRSCIQHGSDALPVAYVSGLNTRSYVCSIAPSIRTTGVSFYPNGMKLLFGVNCAHLTNELPDLINFISRDVVDRVVDTENAERRIKILSDHLIGLLRRSKSDPLSTHGWRIVTSSTEHRLVKDLKHLFNISERQLNRNFHQTLGMSPKQFLRISRFEKSIELMQRMGKRNLAEVAFQLDFSDQSHFIREFKSFSDFTPVQYLNVKKLHEENSAIMIR